MHFTLAAPNSPGLFLKSKADAVCALGNASATINSAIDNLRNNESYCTGSIFLLAGDYDINDSIKLYDCLEISGASMQQTKLNLKTAVDCFV